MASLNSFPTASNRVINIPQPLTEIPPFYLDGRGSRFIQEHRARSPLISCVGNDDIVIRDATFVGNDDWISDGFVHRPTHLLLKGRNILIENCHFLNLCRFGIELLGCESMTVSRCTFSYFDTAPIRSESQGRVGVFCGAYNAKNVRLLDCDFRGAKSADGFANIAKGENIWIERCSVFDYTLEGVQIEAGPAQIRGNHFETTVKHQSTCGVMVYSDSPNRERGDVPYIRDPDFRISDNRFVGGTVGVASREYRPGESGRCSTTVSGNKFWDMALAVMLSTADLFRASDNRADVDTFIQPVAVNAQMLTQEIQLRNNTVRARCGINLGNEIIGTLRCSSNDWSRRNPGDDHWRLIKPRGAYDVVYDCEIFRDHLGVIDSPRISVIKLAGVNGRLRLGVPSDSGIRWIRTE